MGVEKAEIEAMLMVERICLKLMRSKDIGLAELISTVRNELHDQRVIIESALGSVHDLNSLTNLQEKFQVLLDAYKALFESEFRLWSSIPYCYTCEELMPKGRLKNFKDYVFIPAGKKLGVLRERKIPVPVGRINLLAIGFDNKIRNAGAGHNTWEVTDKGTILLHVINPETGKEKNVIELKLEDLKEKVKVMERRCWSMEMGVYLFLANNPDLKSKITLKSNLKKLEMERCLRAFVSERQMELKIFDFDSDRKTLRIELKKDVCIVGERGEVLLGNGQRYDVAVKKAQVKYADQVFGIIQYALYLNDKNPFDVSVKVIGEDDALIAEADFPSSEVSKLTEKINRPNPSRGGLGDEEYTLVGQSLVPYGMRDYFERA